LEFFEPLILNRIITPNLLVRHQIQAQAQAHYLSWKCNFGGAAVFLMRLSNIVADWDQRALGWPAINKHVAGQRLAGGPRHFRALILFGLSSSPSRWHWLHPSK
jgi:hypothetical protein